jgi:NTE family protein
VTSGDPTTVGSGTTRHLDDKEEHGMLAEDFTEANEVQELLAELKRACEGKSFSDVIDDQGNQYVDLVMEGGGVLGVALVGYTYVLEEMGIRFLRVGGTSAGSINAMLVAGLGTPQERKSKKLVKELAEVDFWTFVDGDDDVRDFVQTLVRRPGVFGLSIKGAQIIDSIFGKLGLNPGDAFYDWLSNLLSREGVGTTRKLRERMAQLPPGLRTREGEELGPDRANPYLALVAADVSTQTKIEFPRMAPLYWADPDEVDPALYVRASMSIPYFFYPLRVSDVPQGDRARARWEKLASYEEEPPEICTLVDGGIMSNFPIDLFHLPEKIPAAPTFGAKLGTDQRRSAEINSPQRLGGAVFRSASHTLDYDFIKRNPDYRKLVAYIDTGSHGWLDFDMEKEDKVDLFVRGARKAAEFLTTFDWEGYKKIRRRKKELYV